MFGQFTSIPNALFLDKNLPRSCIIVYGVLQSRAGKNGQIYPSYKTIADDAGISRKTAITAVKSLIKYGYIAKEVRFSDDRGCMTSNFYYLNPNPTMFGLKNVDKSSSYPQTSETDYTTPSVKITPQTKPVLNLKTRAIDNNLNLPIRTHATPANDDSGNETCRPSACETVEILGQAGQKKQKMSFDASAGATLSEKYMQKIGGEK